MARKVSGEIKTCKIQKKQKNGDIYVYERKYRYDPEIGNNRYLGDALLYKIVDGEIQKTRPKRKGKETGPAAFSSQTGNREVTAERKRTGSMEILDFIGAASGIDRDLYGIADFGDAQKIISLARFLVCTSGHTFPLITEWQITHPLPYEDGITEGIYWNLFKKIGSDFELTQNYFKKRLDRCGGELLIAYDSTTESTYSENQDNARYGHSKQGDGLKAIKYLVLYSMNDSQPVAYAREPGNLPDVTSIANAVSQMKALGAKTAEVVTDNGYYSEDNMAEFLHEGMAFITLAKTGLKWVKDEIDAHYGEFGRGSTFCTPEQDMSGITVKVAHTFRHTCQRSDKRTGVVKGQDIFFEKNIYLHIYCNEAKKMAMDRELRKEVVELRDQVNNGLDPEGLNKAGQEKVKKCLILTRKKGGRILAELNNDGIDECNKYHGFMALVSSHEKDAGRCLQKYRMREHIEDNMEIKKDKCDGDKPRNWYDNTHNGKLFVQFVAMGYYDYLYGKLNSIKDEVNQRLLNPEGMNSEELSIWRKLNTWLHDMSLERILAWFDVYETSVVSSKIKRKVWTTENTRRDRLFLKLLGVLKE